MMYVEFMIAPTDLVRCAECRKLICWPEEVRVYAQSANAKPERYEHAEHPVLEGAEQLQVQGPKEK